MPHNQAAPNPAQAPAPTNLLPDLPPSRPAQIPPQTKRESLRSVLSTISILLIAPLIAILLTAFIFQSYQVDGPSMETTLQHNDRLLVWKVPKTWSRITGHPYIPNRGDVVVFTEPRLNEYGQEPGKQLIKRVVALPGEKVVVRNNILTVYNQAHPDGFQPDQTLPYGNSITGTNIDGEWQVGKRQIFVVGDNRYNSLDSRLFGPIDSSNIVGKLAARVLPINQMKRF
jgi:signal peptidase I